MNLKDLTIVLHNCNVVRASGEHPVWLCELIEQTAIHLYKEYLHERNL